jgi:hypothetical protein
VFDTVIFDDANLVNETDCLSALRHGCTRAILFGNPELDHNKFLLNPPSSNRTLLYRTKPTLEISKLI